ncbi:aldolase/citrate lyase family protein [Edwardsiella anguillarum]|nr:aldolase/citrate lyase family protein [Edwardsiella anguillarum]
MIACAGYDFVILDMEHLPHDEERLQHCIHLAQSHGCAPLVRVPNAATKRIGRVLDLGAHGIVLPQVESIAEVTAARDAMRFPPLGRRGITGGGVTGFGTRPLDAYCRQANQGLMLIPMIESAAGLAILDDLLALDGVAMILEGRWTWRSAGARRTAYAPTGDPSAAPHRPPLPRRRRPLLRQPRSERQRDYWLRSGIDAWLCGEDRGLLFRALRQRRDDLRTAASRGPRATDLSL